MVHVVTFVSTLAGTPWLGAIAITGVVSAAVATADSLLLMTGAAVAHDLLRKCYYEPRGLARDERFYLKISRTAIVAVGLLILAKPRRAALWAVLWCAAASLAVHLLG